jgi:superfamily II DNA/RNA helicase
MTFSELGLSTKVLAAITAAGYTEPTPIQVRAIPPALANRDVLGIAQTGTGKTASFVLPMLTRLEQGRARARMPRSLILCPTRELAAQVAENFERYGIHHKLNVALLIGGVSFDEQNKKLDRGADVLIATPGRLLDHQQRGKLLLTGVEILVIDEADRMLDMGFIPDIERICSVLPPNRQTLFFSATMPAEIQRLVDRFLKSPERVEIAPQATTAATITQRFKYVDWDPKQKRDVLRRWIRDEDVKNAIIFCNRKTDVDILFKSLSKHGFNVGCLHGDMDQHNRTATLEAFRAGTITFLAASDVAARGLDIPEVSHVFNFDIPVHAEDYVHRIGRTGRAGRKGFSGTLVTSDDMRTLKEIEKIVRANLEWVDGPPPDDVLSDTSSRRGRPGKGRVRKRDDKPQRSQSAKPTRLQQSGGPEVDATIGEQPVGERRLPSVRQRDATRPQRAPVQARGPDDQPDGAFPIDAAGVAGSLPAVRRSRRGAERQDRPERSDKPVRGERSAHSERPESRERPERAGASGADRSERRPENRSENRPERVRGDRQPSFEPVRGGAPASRSASTGAGNRRSPDRDDGPSVLGLGDHVPDFMRRPVKVRNE